MYVQREGAHRPKRGLDTPGMQRKQPPNGIFVHGIKYNKKRETAFIVGNIRHLSLPNSQANDPLFRSKVSFPDLRTPPEPPAQ